MKKLSASIFLFFLISVLLSGIDFGGNITDTSVISYSDELTENNEDKLSLWLSADFSDTIKFSSKGSYTYSIARPYMFELDLLNIRSDSDSLFSYTLGRLWTSDFSGNIFNHTMDGGKAELNFPDANLSISAGYTGLLYKKSSSVLISRADQSDLLNSENVFASPRLIAGIDLLLPELIYAQDLNVSFWMQMDLRSESELLDEGPALPSLQGGKLQTQYSGLGLRGTLASSLYYDSSFFLGTGTTLSYIDAAYTYENILSFLGSFGLRYYSEDRFYSKAGFRFIYSSGDSDYSSDFVEGNTSGASTNFIPISRPGFGLIFSPQLGNMFLVQLNYSMKPFGTSTNQKLRNIQTELRAFGFFRSTVGEISEPGIDPLSDSLYLGTEIDAVINFRLFSDFGMSLSSGVFIPDTSVAGAFLATERNVEVTGKAEFSFSF